MELLEAIDAQAGYHALYRCRRARGRFSVVPTPPPLPVYDAGRNTATFTVGFGEEGKRYDDQEARELAAFSGPPSRTSNARVAELLL